MSERKRIFADVLSTLGLGPRPRSLIGGNLMEGAGETILLVDPFTEEVLTDYADACAELVEKACLAANDAQRHWAKDRSAAARGQVRRILRALSSTRRSLWPVSNR